MSQINQRLQKLFHEDDHRIVLWYGNDSTEMTAEFEAMELAGVTKLNVQHQALKTKFAVQVEQTDDKDKFLLFSPGKVPESDADNWLLDLQLAYPLFSTDEYAVYRDELKLDRTADKVLKTYRTFFANKDRREQLRQRLPSTVANDRELELGMLGALLRCEPRVTEIFLALISAYPERDRPELSETTRRKLSQREEVEKEITNHGLDQPLWEYAERTYGYQSAEPGVEDFVKALFVSRFSELVPGQPRRVRREADLLLHRWQDSERTRPTFELMARRLGSEWNVAEKMAKLPLKDLQRADLFVEIDRRLLSGLRDEILKGEITAERVHGLINDREGTFWFEAYVHHYAALRAATTFLALQRSLHLRTGAQNSLTDYTRQQHQVDQAYRQFHYHLRYVSDPLLQPLVEPLERHYTTGFLHPLNQHWQQQLDTEGFPPPGLSMARQSGFWKTNIEPYVKRGNRIFVIISDGLRYESAAELSDWLPTLGRYRTELEPMLAAAPTFTQLGMAALLPHEALQLRGDGMVTADGQSTQGTANRDKILKAAANGRAVAITAPDLLRDYSARAAGRAWVKNYDVIYIYHNLIDQAGEKEEDQLFVRTQKCFEEIEQLLTIIARMNGNNIIITADHGYLFQHSPLEDNDYASYKVIGDDQKYNRRFVLGTQLEQDPGAMHFTAEQLGLSGDLEIVIPRSVHRLRRSGSGSRYVHGGLSLQELVVPTLRVSIGRTANDDALPVDVEVIAGNGRITNNEYSVRFFQKQAVGGKRSERSLRIGFFDAEDKLISEEQKIVFSSDAAEERKRETRLSFRFGTDAAVGGKRPVKLRLRDPSGAVIIEHPFILDITFGSDFD